MKNILKLKNNWIIPVIVLSIIVVFDVAFIVYMNYQKVDSQYDISKINEYYGEFSSAVDNFFYDRDTFYKIKSEDFYLALSDDKVTYINSFINNYNNDISLVDEVSLLLKNLCVKTYANEEANTQCRKYTANMEFTINSYVSDIIIYNEFVNKHNEYMKKVSLNLVDLNYEYVDLNNDDQFTGKSGDNSEE